jgi:hypothetical protein
MNKEKLVHVFFIGIMTLIGFTFIGSLILFFVEDLEISLLLENTFFIFIAIVSMLSVNVFEKYFKLVFPWGLKIALYVFFFGLFIVGNVYKVFISTEWFDKILHFSSGGFLAFTGILFGYKWLPTASLKVKGYIGIMYAVFVAVLWEIFEFVGDVLLSLIYPTYEYRMQFFHVDYSVWIFPQPYGLLDTMLDVILDLLGAIIVVVIYINWKKRKGELE